MYVNVAVLKETQPHERRVALVPSVVPQIDQTGREAAYANRSRRRHQTGRCRVQRCRVHRGSKELVADADLVLPCNLRRST